ncbi:MAG: CDP-glucose 4,6-dehydratase [Roseibium sp.]|uniref:CDP-glucose 4,6-dehydratase n=1 Tax=Roseibium sp. TaxID=1936156 RepID=UPI00262F8691|nr:CDP-glucose 4,6-dehydratase [Roseibium sp.]MCV0425567.1 CDP-glucose 4,6-dehydratase [Roseibium sp.]
MNFWQDKKVLVTGHTGFKGAWLCELLMGRGAIVSGIALPPENESSLFVQLNLENRMASTFADIRDAAALEHEVKAFAPDIVLHLAAQSLVRRSYRDPVGNWATNVMGTIHLLDALHRMDRPITAIIVTTDKVYENNEWAYSYRETDPLGGHDPYSASKAATELVSASWRRSFGGNLLKIATARAGNVIGGGDWAEDRLIPDIIRSLMSGNPIEIRNPLSTRPWQHVLDPLNGYLLLAERVHQTEDPSFQTAFNFGPEPADVFPVRGLVNSILECWSGTWIDASDPDAVHEAGRLSLSIDKARSELGWTPVWRFEQSIRQTIEWYRGVSEGADPVQFTQEQIVAFEGDK